MSRVRRSLAVYCTVIFRASSFVHWQYFHGRLAGFPRNFGRGWMGVSEPGLGYRIVAPVETRPGRARRLIIAPPLQDARSRAEALLALSMWRSSCIIPPGCRHHYPRIVIHKLYERPCLITERNDGPRDDVQGMRTVTIGASSEHLRLRSTWSKIKREPRLHRIRSESDKPHPAPR